MPCSIGTGADFLHLGHLFANDYVQPGLVCPLRVPHDTKYACFPKIVSWLLQLMASPMESRLAACWDTLRAGFGTPFTSSAAGTGAT